MVDIGHRFMRVVNKATGVQVDYDLALHTFTVYPTSEAPLSSKERLADIDLSALIEAYTLNPRLPLFPDAVLKCLTELQERRASETEAPQRLASELKCIHSVTITQYCQRCADFNSHMDEGIRSICFGSDGIFAPQRGAEKTSVGPVVNLGYIATAHGYIIREGDEAGEWIATFKRESDADGYVRMRAAEKTTPELESGLLMRAQVLICQQIGLNNRRVIEPMERDVDTWMRQWLVDFADGADESSTQNGKG